LRIYGMVTIEDGQVLGGGKLFELDKSEIYFNGSNPINPHLNLNVRHQTLDYIDIQIYITNTLSSPVVILASNPVMSQNDIMSYILFGEPASSAFSSSGEGSKTFAVSSLLLATGLKQIFNDSAGVNIDTLNILTNEEGTLGYEIGTRFSKDIRVLYKNDTVSSVILQYSLSRSIRLDIDVHETGQGVSILYIKDF
jgi:translocation and assembly module TamB